MGARWNDGRRFGGRVAVVTGDGGTLGGAVARGFGLEGASVALGYRSSRSQAANVVTELEGRGGHAHCGHLDVTDQDSVDAFVADVAECYGRLDVLVNAAGRLDEADTLRFSELGLRVRRRAVPRRAGSRRSARSRPSPRPAVPRTWPGTVGHREGWWEPARSQTARPIAARSRWPSSAWRTSSFCGSDPHVALCTQKQQPGGR
jgi:NAD(P)-dependent dehydrogenase (short-subunit alcohol dehydrogenase family)